MAQTVYDPPVSTYIPLQTITLGASASSVTFASIPQTYRDLVLITNGLATDVQDVTVSLNGSSSGFTGVRMFAAASSGSNVYTSSAAIFVVSSTPISTTTQFMDYSATDKHKTILSRVSSAPGAYSYVAASAHRWAVTDSINSITLTVSGGHSYVAGATFSLYGIEA
jgi:hypothetical protein